jgi:hypothetical protein
MPTEQAPQTPTIRRDLAPAGLVFVVAATAVWCLWANRLFLSLDEGIYLAGALRVLHGQAPYRDFFVLTGPGSFWIEAGILGLLGTTLQNARLALVLDLALLSATVYWLSVCLCGRKFALAVTALFFALETRPLFRLYVNHRWDSGALGLLAVTFVFAGTEYPRFRTFLLAGIAVAVAAWITPSLLVVGAFLALWVLFISDLRRYCIPYLIGIASVSVLAGGILALQGALVPMFRDLLWTTNHYPAANCVPYGYGAIAAGGLRAMFAGATASAFVARATGLVAVLVPVVLPVAVYAIWMVRRLRRPQIDRQEKLAILLMLASFGFVISTYPRWSADQLLFIAPIFYVLAAYLLSRILTGRVVRAFAGGLALALAVAALSYSVLQVMSEPVIETHVGAVRAAPAGRSIIRLATARITPGDTLFVYPYLPMLYFLTGARNPTRYSFLQPGMMQAADYEKTLADLRGHPPKWVFYFALPLETYHGIWPAADPHALNLTPVDHFILSNYHPGGVLQSSGTHFFLLERGAN